MIYLELFLTFLKIGAVSFGGGYGMISMIREECLTHGWISEDALLNYIAVSESTPGPIAVNMATFVGSSQAGFLGSLVATFGIILPSFIIILLVATIIKNLVKYKSFKAVISGIKPIIVGLIFATAIIMALKVFLGFENKDSSITFSYFSVIIFAIIIAISIIYKKLRKKEISPILLIIISGILGLIFFSI